MSDSEKSEINKTIDVPALIERIYSTVLEPERYDELMAEWEVHVAGALRALEDGDIERPHPPAEHHAAPHVSNALAMFDRLGRPVGIQASGEDLLEREHDAALLVERTGQIVQVNSKAARLFGAETASHLAQLPIDADGLAQFETILLHAEKHVPGKLLAITNAYREDDEQPCVVALTRVPTPLSEPSLFKLASVSVVWSDHIGSLLRDAFALTQAEYQITRLLIEGRTADAIAQARRSTIGTTRTQIKSILQKTGTRSQASLVRMVAALSAFAGDDTFSRPVRRARAHVEHFTITPGGRRLRVSLIGAQDGRPVLYLHGMIDGHSAPLFNCAALAERGIKLIVPARPGFGASEPYRSPKGAPERFARDIEAVLDHCGIASCPVIGHFAGAFYAYAAAAVLGPDRITHVLNVSGVVPMTTARHFSSLAPRQRVLAYTSRYAPSLLPMLARGAVALIDKGGHEKFMEMAYAKQHADWLVARRDTVFPLLCEGYDFMASQGTSGLEIDAYNMVRKDWSREANLCRQPVTLIHGEHDPAVPLWSVRAFAAGRPNTMLHEMPECGQLIFYAFPERVLDVLETILATDR